MSLTLTEAPGDPAPMSKPPILLVCEGACNADLARLDAAVTVYRQEEFRHCGTPGGTREALADEDLVHRLHQLHHTPHRKLGATLWACEVCHATRRW